ncbi:helix-turn-helix domain-containing protein [Nocardia terpenica]|uniref:PucR family transcriptional regulator n=1 Tax=Nocardia terpenica TaxID=455432 RepID=A0A6G9Z691_9NOCA|nr:helix-turn-helix domain-containing protein [Nocardia terpenica]MBF6060013.1 helix-turn-helix domain-containing protein [Nocardia terpenica]MBF6102446.1 helix-turn-helix domain-containing protein [Nocardia terpenica]MBF6111363.1 helix-turn-helix domain-containing protein [Nocardia terpenica]MBF6117494.1 helix-turn-helix domain-containing protein [Nocardia terpenica]MBF6150665.1 helix-turn-helix domain-containing protein [Nocardia terpenica]
MKQTPGLVSLRQLVAHPVLAGARAVGGPVVDTAVRRVCVRSGVDASGLGDGDLIVVAGLTDSTGWQVEAGIRRCALAGVAGLVLPGGPHGPLATSVLLAERLGLPLVLLPETASPHEAALRLAQLVSTPEVVRSEHVLGFLRRIPGRAESLGSVIKAAAEVLQAPVSALSPDGDLVHGDHSPAEFRRDLALPQVVVEGETTFVIHPVRTGSAPLWLATALTRPAQALVESAQAVLAAAEPWVLAWLATQRLDAERDARARTTLLSDLLRLREEAGPVPRHRAAVLGWRLDGWHMGIYIRRLNESPYDNLGDRDEMLRALGDTGINGPLVEQSDGWVTWHTTKDDPSPQEVDDLLGSIRKALARLGSRLEIAAGVGRGHPGIGGLGRTVDEAREAALSIDPTTMDTTQDIGTRIAHIDTLGVGRLVRAWTRSRSARALATTLLAPLSDQELLLTTLDVYLEHESSVVATAAALGLHRNTVADRIARTQRMLGVNLRDPDDRLAVELACRTLRPKVRRAQQESIV